MRRRGHLASDGPYGAVVSLRLPRSSPPNARKEQRPYQRLVIASAPGLLAAAFVLSVFADTGTMLYELPRAMAGTVAIAIAVQAIGTAGTRSLSVGSLLTIAMFAIVVDLRSIVAVLALAAAWFLARRTGWVHELPAGVAVIVALVFFLSIGRAVTSTAFDLGDLQRALNGAGSGSSADPDIYLIMLDGYPRSDTLAEFGYENDWFVDELTDRGFHVATDSSTNYPFTGLVLATMMNMAHLHEIDALHPIPPSDVEQLRALSAAINRNPVLRTLEERGYWTASTGLTEVRGTMRDVDEYLDRGEVRLWERQVMQRTSLWPLLCEAVVMPQHRALIDSTFRNIGEFAAEDRRDPTFLFSHVMSPHTPIVFGRDGGAPEIQASGECGVQFAANAETLGLTVKEYGQAMGDQVHYLNTRTVATIDGILAASPDAVVIVFSDHGGRFSPAPSDEWFRSFFAARTPGHDGLFGNNARPIETFPKLFGAYFGLSHPAPEDHSFVPLSWGIVRLLEVAPWPP